MGTDEYLQVKDVAKMFRVHPNTIRRWISTGEMPAKKVGKIYFIDAHELKGWVKTR